MSVSVRPRVGLVRLVVVAAGIAILIGWSMSGVGARQAQGTTGVIAGTVESPAGPEAGVWVIAETDDLETKFVKIVVTDDTGRFLLPDLPSATYGVWVRGYGLVDSEKGPAIAQSGRRQADRRRRADPGGRCPVLPRELLVLPHRAAAQE